MRWKFAKRKTNTNTLDLVTFPLEALANKNFYLKSADQVWKPKNVYENTQKHKTVWSWMKLSQNETGLQFFFLHVIFFFFKATATNTHFHTLETKCQQDFRKFEIFPNPTAHPTHSNKKKIFIEYKPRYTNINTKKQFIKRRLELPKYFYWNFILFHSIFNGFIVNAFCSL